MPWRIRWSQIVSSKVLSSIQIERLGCICFYSFNSFNIFSFNFNQSGKEIRRRRDTTDVRRDRNAEKISSIAWDYINTTIFNISFHSTYWNHYLIPSVKDSYQQTAFDLRSLWIIASDSTPRDIITITSSIFHSHLLRICD